MGPFDKVNFHITGLGGDVLSQLISGGGKRSRHLSDCVTVNIVTDESEKDTYVKDKVEEADEVSG